MKTNKEIVTEIIEDLENTVGINWPTDRRVKVTRDKLIECWSEYRKDPDYKFYGYKCEDSTRNNYKKLFSIFNKGTNERWKSYILRNYNYKYCSGCRKLLEMYNFSKYANTISGVQDTCKNCQNLYKNNNKEHLVNYGKNYRKDNSEKEKQRHKAYRLENSEKISKYRKLNKEKIKEYNSKYYIQNKDKFYASSSKRRASKLQRTPSWESKEDAQKIIDLYIQAKELEKLHGIKYHVDHIIPLQGILVSGLHVFNNLQVIPAKENLAKSNKYTIG